MQNKLSIIIPVMICFISCALPMIVSVKSADVKPAEDIAYQLSENEIILPELLYLSQEEAAQKLESLGLSAVIGESVHNSVIPENQVLTQTPSAGAVLSPGDAVTLTISDGWKEYVPNVIDLPKEKAAEKLEELGFEVKYQEKSSDTTAPGAVISQSFPADSKIPIGTVVSLIISTGRENTDSSKTETVGNYVGMDFEEAKAELSELFLYAMQADTVYDPDIPNGTIISQDIAPGTEVSQGTSIQMKVSLGQVTVHVPDCAGQMADDARKLLEDAGLTCMMIYTASSSYPLDYVMSQNEPAGSSIAVGSQVWLTASVGSSSYVISTGGWSGNPLPSFTSEPETEPPTEPEPTPGEIITDIYETAPDIIPEPEEPEIIEPEIPEIIIETAPPDIIPDIPVIETDPIIETNPDGYQDAPETAPF